MDNYPHNEYEYSDELRAATEEILKSIRQIVQMNPLYREALASIIHPQTQVRACY